MTHIEQTTTSYMLSHFASKSPEQYSGTHSRSK